MIRELKTVEEKNRNFLAHHYPETSTLIITKTGFKKSIVDATLSFRETLKIMGIHNYDKQKQGSKNKVIRTGYIWNENEFIKSTVSLYRPSTKNGDPRIWFRKIKKFIKSGNKAVGVICVGKDLYIFDLAKLNPDNALNHKFFNQIKPYGTAKELYGKLKTISSKWRPSIKKGDCAVGDTLEKLLKIKPNPYRKPDYKGIELKANRSRSKNSNLFAKTPCWGISTCKCGLDIVEKYGYKRKTDNRLTISVNAIKPTRGLILVVNYEDETIDEIFIKGNKRIPVIRWHFEDIIYSLLNKHRETFWIKSEVKIKNKKEHFLYTTIKHTRKPIIENIFRLIEEGSIYVDHTHSRGGLRDHGYLFKLKPKGFNELFPYPLRYELHQNLKPVL